MEKNIIFNRRYIFTWWISHCYVSLPECRFLQQWSFGRLFFLRVVEVKHLPGYLKGWMFRWRQGVKKLVSKMIRLMIQKSFAPVATYCWWKKSQTTTWDVSNFGNTGLNYLSLNGLAGFLAINSSVSHDPPVLYIPSGRLFYFHQQ